MWFAVCTLLTQSMARRHPATARLRRVSHELCNSIAAACLLECFFLLEFVNAGHPTLGAFYRADRRALDDFESLDLSTVRRAIGHLRQRGLITAPKRALEDARMTRAGRRWAEERFPTYHADRPWDGRMYLVTYDIPRRLRNTAVQLRSFLRTLRCAPLQASVWITPYNPRGLLKSFVRERDVPGCIIAEFERGSTIGEGSFRHLVAEAYTLDDLDKRYEEFLDEFRERRDAAPFEVASAYTAILRDDPQLPFTLLPGTWHGDEAYAFTRRQYRTRRAE